MRGPAADAAKAAYKAADVKNVPMLQQKLKEISYGEEELARFREVAGKPVWDEWVKEYSDRIPAQEILDFVFAKAAEGAKMKKMGKL